MKNTDLHVHSYYSDGDLSPSKIVKLAKQKRIKNLALTDHNSFDGIAEAIEEGKKQGINIIPAIEIRAKEGEVLGYFIDYKNKEFKKELKKIQENIVNRIKKIIIKLNKKGIQVSFNDLIKEYYSNKNLMEIHLIKYLKSQDLGRIRILWQKYISKEGETYVPIKEISVINAIKLIKKYKGVPILAHPWAEPSSKGLLNEKNFKKLVKAGLKGIEIDNGDRNKKRDKKTLEKIKELGKRHNLIITSGSDFHGDYIVQATKCHCLGGYNCDEEVVKKIKEISSISEVEIKLNEKIWNKEFQHIEKLLRLNQNISRSKKHLDFGCGRGIFSNILAERFPKVNFEGMDQNNAKIQIAKRRYKMKNLKFKCSQRVEGKYDSLTSIFVIHEIKEAEKILKDFYKNLNKGGKILIYDFKKISKKEFKRLYEKGIFNGSFEEEYKEHNRWTLKEFEQMCKKVGFKTIEIIPVNKNMFVYIGEKI